MFLLDFCIMFHSGVLCFIFCQSITKSSSNPLKGVWSPLIVLKHIRCPIRVTFALSSVPPVRLLQSGRFLSVHSCCPGIFLHYYLRNHHHGNSFCLSSVSSPCSWITYLFLSWFMLSFSCGAQHLVPEVPSSTFSSQHEKDFMGGKNFWDVICLEEMPFWFGWLTFSLRIWKAFFFFVC